MTYRSRIVIAGADAALRRRIKNFLVKAAIQVVAEAEDSASALRAIRTVEADLVILDTDLPGIGSLEIAKIIEEDRLAPILLLTSTWQKDLVEKAREWRVFAFLVKPVTEANLIAAVESALANYQKLLKLEQEVVRLKETLENRKLVEKAKGILMTDLRLSEQEAFRRIQTQSMNRSVSMRTVAEAIIMAHDLHKR